MWLQMHRAYMERGYIDDHLNRYHHTLHCQEITLHDMPLTNISTVGKILYPNCVDLRDKSLVHKSYEPLEKEKALEDGHSV